MTMHDDVRSKVMMMMTVVMMMVMMMMVVMMMTHLHDVVRSKGFPY